MFRIMVEYEGDGPGIWLVRSINAVAAVLKLIEKEPGVVQYNARGKHATGMTVNLIHGEFIQ